MAALSHNAQTEGISVDVLFAAPGPTLGDLFLMCREPDPRFSPSGRFAFDSLGELRFEHVDDYFGVRAQDDEGDEIHVWLLPLVQGEPVDHHGGPFTGIRLEYNVLRNPLRRAQHFLKCVQAFAMFGTRVHYRSRQVDLTMPTDLEQVRADIDDIALFWEDEGIEVGSDDALETDY